MLWEAVEVFYVHDVVAVAGIFLEAGAEVVKCEHTEVIHLTAVRLLKGLHHVTQGHAQCHVPDQLTRVTHMSGSSTLQ